MRRTATWHQIDVKLNLMITVLCFIAGSCFCKYSSVFCIPPYSVFCIPVYCGSDNVGLDRCGVEFESSRSKLWELPLVSCGSITFLHTAHKYEIQTHTNTNTKFTQRVTNTKKGEFKGRCKVQRLHFSVWLSLDCIVYIIHICSLLQQSWQSVVLTSSNLNDRVALSCRV